MLKTGRSTGAALASLALAAALAGKAGAASAGKAGAAPAAKTSAAPAGKPAATAPLMGFTAEHAAEERALEARFDRLLDPEDQRAWLKRLAARPHHVGSPYDKENAEYLAQLFRSFGFDTRIEEFQVLFPTPKERVLEMVAPSRFTAALAEPEIPEDATSGQHGEQLPTYNAYSIDGDVTGELVYVNYGVPKDYEELELRGIDVRGKIVLARYGGSWRGIKPKVAAEHGALGCIIYSDPRNDGYFQGDVYPRGGWRGAPAVQRGSVADMPLYPGDPLTPGVGATPEAKRLDLKEARTLTRIPVLPISYADAEPLLRAMAGPMAPEAWRGALPLPYHLGPGPARVHLKVASNWKLEPVRDVIAKLAGSDRPEEWIVRGNHHDGWVNGAADPLSGLVAELAEAKAIGELARTGWRPRRTLVYAAWDGEEPGLLGSTEWVETHADLLREQAVAYVNTDGNGRGFLGASGSHTFEKFFGQVAEDVVDPEKKISVAARLRAAFALFPDDADPENRGARELVLAALGSGSDYTAFIDHLGIASFDIGYGGEEQYGQYHSIYDSFDHYTRFMDPRFEYGVALAQTAGRTVLRLADADTLPFEFTRFSDTVGRYLKQVKDLVDKMRKETAEKNKQIADGTYQAFFDPTETWVVPKPREPVPFLNFAPLDNALARLQKSAQDYQHAMEAASAGGAQPPEATRRALNAVLRKTERALAGGRGLPRRPWFQHLVYAPGFYTGYGVKTLPGVREAIEQRNRTEAEQQAVEAAKALEAFAAEVDRATAILKGSAGKSAAAGG
jgi:N-acetylated-alpha-linked acidic dipeptidase